MLCGLKRPVKPRSIELGEIASAIGATLATEWQTDGRTTTCARRAAKVLLDKSEYRAVYFFQYFEICIPLNGIWAFEPELYVPEQDDSMNFGMEGKIGEEEAHGSVYPHGNTLSRL